MPHTGWTLEKKPQNRTQQIEMGLLAAADASDWEYMLLMTHGSRNIHSVQHSDLGVRPVGH